MKKIGRIILTRYFHTRNEINRRDEDESGGGSQTEQEGKGGGRGYIFKEKPITEVNCAFSGSLGSWFGQGWSKIVEKAAKSVSSATNSSTSVQGSNISVSNFVHI